MGTRTCHCGVSSDTGDSRPRGIGRAAWQGAFRVCTRCIGPAALLPEWNSPSAARLPFLRLRKKFPLSHPGRADTAATELVAAGAGRSFRLPTRDRSQSERRHVPPRPPLAQIPMPTTIPEPSDKAKLNRLRCRYAYMFRHPGLIDIYRGWMEPLERLCAEIEELLGNSCRGFQFHRIKEKFGACRIYFSFEPSTPGSSCARRQTRGSLDREDELRRLIQKRIQSTEAITSVRCMVCGAKGEINVRRALVCLCPEHASHSDVNP